MQNKEGLLEYIEKRDLLVMKGKDIIESLKEDYEIFGDKDVSFESWSPYVEGDLVDNKDYVINGEITKLYTLKEIEKEYEESKKNNKRKRDIMKRKYKVYLTWEMCGVLEVEAGSEAEAIAIAMDDSTELPCDSYYIDGSLELNDQMMDWEREKRQAEAFQWTQLKKGLFLNNKTPIIGVSEYGEEWTLATVSSTGEVKYFHRGAEEYKEVQDLIKEILLMWLEEKSYGYYKVDWCKERGYDAENIDAYDEENGINGEFYAAFEEFMDCEFQDEEYMKYLLNEKDFELWKAQKKNQDCDIKNFIYENKDSLVNLE